MISKQELAEIKEKKRVSLYQEEKEYLQYIFLNAISKYSENFIFKGGTCLRICYGLERASEDLDFSVNLPVNKAKEIIKKCLKDFEFLNINYKIYSEKEFEGNFRIEIRFEGPLFKGDLRTTNTLKIDFNKGKVKHGAAKVVAKLFSDVPVFTIVVLDEKEIFAEKIRTLINRQEPRDLYDIWIMLGKKAEVDKKLIFEKMKEENSKFSQLRFPSENEYEISLKNLLEYLPPYEQVVSEVKKFIDSLK